LFIANTIRHTWCKESGYPCVSSRNPVRWSDWLWLCVITWKRTAGWLVNTVTTLPLTTSRILSHRRHIIITHRHTFITPEQCTKR